MPSKKQTAAKKRKVPVGAVEVLAPPKKRMPVNAFQPNNEYAKRWTKGMPSPNPSGGPKRDGLRLVSRALRVQLNQHAPNAECLAVGLLPGASWAQVVAASILRQSARGDMAAARLLLDFTEKVNNARIDVPVDDDGNPIVMTPPSLNIVFTDAPAGGEVLRQDLLGAEPTSGQLPPGE